jgi:hypothetical protein
MKRISFVLLITLHLPISDACSYEIESHLVLTELAVEKSSVSDINFISKVLGLVLPYDSKQNTFLFEKFSGSGVEGAENPKNIIDLVKYGADYEDNNVLFGEHRPINHFYDPQNNGSELTIPLTNYSSPDWVLENPELSAQEYSYKDARIALYDAITNSDFFERGRSFGRFFQILGQIMHHMQDMSQPEHVRSDAHLTLEGLIPNLPDVLDIDPSAYEKYIKELLLEQLIRNQQPIPNSSKIINNTYNNNEKVMFPMPHDFWGGPPDKDMEKKGAAEFTSANFVSKDTNFSYISHGNYAAHSSKHPLPDPASAITTAEDFLSVTDCAINQNIPGMVYWIGTDVVDEYTGGEPVFNKMMSSYSIFNEDLEIYNIDTSGFPYDEDDQVSLQTSINSCTFNAAMGFLIPRAIAFSAGIIDYMLRGRIEISVPDEGVYSVVDHAITNQAGTGFDKIKVKLRNVTDDIPPVPGDQSGTGSQPVVQDIYDGVMEAVVKYRINPCYQSDLTGELKYVYGDPFPPVPINLGQQTTWSGCNGNDYYSGAEEITVSLPVTLAAGESLPKDTGKEYTFFFTNDIPVDAIDVRLQIIFKGKLGSINNPELAESNAVVVSTKDISEPSFIHVTNTTDYKIQLSEAGNPAQYVSSGQGAPLGIDIRTHHASSGYSIASANLQVGEYARLALLTDKSSLLMSFNSEAGEYSIGDTAGFYFSDNELRANSRNFFDGRGIYFHSISKRISDTEVIPVYDGLCDIHSTVTGQRLPNTTEIKQLQESCRNLPPLAENPTPVTLYFN